YRSNTALAPVRTKWVLPPGSNSPFARHEPDAGSERENYLQRPRSYHFPSEFLRAIALPCSSKTIAWVRSNYKLMTSPFSGVGSALPHLIARGFSRFLICA